MISGSVLPGGDAVVAVRLRGQITTSQVDVVVDTGFTDWLTLPRDAIARLGLPFRQETAYVLADGTRVSLREFVAEIEWHGAWRSVFVAETDGDPLLGMALLKGSHVGIDVVDGGKVAIAELPGSRYFPNN